MGKTQYWILWEALSGTGNVKRVDQVWNAYQGELSETLVLSLVTYQNRVGLTHDDADSAVLQFIRGNKR